MDRIEIALTRPNRKVGWPDPREVTISINGRRLDELVDSRAYDLVGIGPSELPPKGHLLGRPSDDLAIDGRSALFICPECGDLGCGAVLARITVREDVVVWDDFIHGNTWDPEDTRFSLEFTFDRVAYERTLWSAARDAA
jgi:hypothetical protein